MYTRGIIGDYQPQLHTKEEVLSCWMCIHITTDATTNVGIFLVMPTTRLCAQVADRVQGF